MIEFGLLAQARARPSATALVHGDRCTSYAELDDRVRRAARALRGLGVGAGDRVAVMAGNRPEWFEVVHACGRLGAVAVPVNVHLLAAETAWIVADSGAAAVVVERDLVASLADCPAAARLIIDAGYEEALAGAAAGDAAPPPPGDGWPATMLYTSGTTGRPKGVVAGDDDPRRRAAGAALMASAFSIGPQDVHLLSGPAYHAGPAMWAQMHLAVGGSVVVMPRWDAPLALELIERHRVTTCHLVPANLIRILELPERVRSSYDLSSLRLVMHAAAPCPIATKRAFMELVGPGKVWEYYGASEGGGVVIGPEEWLNHPGSVGRPIGYEVVILDDQGEPVPAGVDGVIYIGSPFTPFRYHNDEAKTAAAFRGRLFTVGDIGHLDEDGYLYITDRRSDLIISGGVNIYPREVEDALLAHPAVADCAVVGVPDARWGQAVMATVQPRAETAVTEDELIDWCRLRLASFKCPRTVRLVAELPREPTGKLLKHRLVADSSPG